MTITEEFAEKVRKDNLRERVMQIAPVMVLILLILVFSIACGHDFASKENLVAILNQMAIPLIVAFGLTLRSMPVSGAAGERTAEVGIALKQQDGEKEFFVSQDEAGIVMGTIPGNVAGAPTIAWLAHQDTSPEASGKKQPSLQRESETGNQSQSFASR